MQLKIENKIYEVETGTVVRDLISERKDIYAVMINGKLYDLQDPLKEEGEGCFIYENSEMGKQIYQRSLSFLFIAAVKQVFADGSVCIHHSLANGLYCEISTASLFTPQDVDRIRYAMKKMVEQKMVIGKTTCKKEEAIAYFTKLNMEDKAKLLRYDTHEDCSIYSLCGNDDYFYGVMLPDTSYLTHFGLRYYAPGVWLSSQEQFVDQRKLFGVFQEFEQWGRLIGVSNVSQLNQCIIQGNMDELVMMSETMIEKKLSQLADEILYEHPKTRFILISGPSSAGKSSFSRRLAIHLKIAGKKPITISMDNFYKLRKDCPRMADGSYDFESIDALDMELFNETLLKMERKIPVHMPLFDFKSGTRKYCKEETILNDEQILIIEGIHGLHPKTGCYLPNDAKFKIYINALTHLNLDDHNRISTSDYRLIRRIARDYPSRGSKASETIALWKNVRDGEDRYIYPYQEEADYIFNTSMVYELAVLKDPVITQLDEITCDMPQYMEAQRLKNLLSYFISAKSEAIPRNSILAEFLGTSILDVS